jgi:O-6-methylguanine DNA methyltransferase
VDVTRDGSAVRHRYAVGGWGVGEIVARDDVLLSHALPSRRRQLSTRDSSAEGADGQAAVSPPARGPHGGASIPGVTISPNPSHICAEFVSDLCRRFADHLGGSPVTYDDVEVEWYGLSPFQRELLDAARSVAWGEVVTYGGLAALAGRPRAARAAGSFCAGNRFSLVVPCHRIVAAGREEPYELGGYGPSGSRLKRRLLALEGTLL